MGRKNLFSIFESIAVSKWTRVVLERQYLKRRRRPAQICPRKIPLKALTWTPRLGRAWWTRFSCGQPRNLGRSSTMSSYFYPRSFSSRPSSLTSSPRPSISRRGARLQGQRPPGAPQGSTTRQTNNPKTPKQKTPPHKDVQIPTFHTPQKNAIKVTIFRQPLIQAKWIRTSSKCSILFMWKKSIFSYLYITSAQKLGHCGCKPYDYRFHYTIATTLVNSFSSLVSKICHSGQGILESHWGRWSIPCPVRVLHGMYPMASWELIFFPSLKVNKGDFFDIFTKNYVLWPKIAIPLIIYFLAAVRVPLAKVCFVTIPLK